MDTFIWLAIWAGAIFASSLMAEKRERDKRWAIVGGLLFGWFTPLYYLIVGDSKQLKEEKFAKEVKKQMEKENV